MCVIFFIIMCWHKQIKLHKKLFFNLVFIIIFNVFNFIIRIIILFKLHKKLFFNYIFFIKNFTLILFALYYISNFKFNFVFKIWEWLL